MFILAYVFNPVPMGHYPGMIHVDDIMSICRAGTSVVYGVSRTALCILNIMLNVSTIYIHYLSLIPGSYNTLDFL